MAVEWVGSVLLDGRVLVKRVMVVEWWGTANGDITWQIITDVVYGVHCLPD